MPGKKPKFTHICCYNSNRVDVLGRKYVFGPSQNSFNFSPSRMSLSRAKNIFTPANINSIVILIYYALTGGTDACSFDSGYHPPPDPPLR